MFMPASNRNSLMRFDISEKSLRNALKNTATAVSRLDYIGLRITPDGLYGLVGSNASPYLRVLDPVTDAWVTPIVTLPGSVVNDIAFKDDGTEFAVAMGASPFLYRYSYPGFAILTTTATPPAGAVQGLSYNGAGTKLALALSVSPYIEVFDVATITKETFTMLSGAPTAIMHDISFSPDGTMIAAVSNTSGGRTCRVWAYPSGTLLFSDTGTTGSYKCQFSPDGTKLATMRGTTIRIYNTSTWAFSDVSASSAGDFYSLNARNIRWIDNEYLFFSSEGGSCIIINTTTNTQIAGVEHGLSVSVGPGEISPLTKPRKLAGTVEDDLGNPVARTIRAYDTASGVFLGQTTSDGVTGAFSMLIWSAELCTVYAIGAGGENAKVFDPVTPALWP